MRSVVFFFGKHLLTEYKGVSGWPDVNVWATLLPDSTATIDSETRISYLFATISRHFD